MHKKFLSLFAMLLIIISLMPACEGISEPTPTPPPSSTPTPVPSGTYASLSNHITNIDTSIPSSLAEILGALQNIENAESQGSISETEADNLQGQMETKFSSWIRETVDAIDPAKPESMKDFFDLQAVQRTSEYDEYVAPETKEYKEEQMAEKFNEWVRNRVNEIDPEDQGALKDMFDLQVIQRTGKYDELVTTDTHDYKEEQMGEKLNEWVRNRVDEIDPTDPDNLKYFFWLQTIQHTEKYDKFATPETHDYKEQQMKQKFNEWVENRVNELDPNDPNFLEELEKLRVLQLSDKYDRFIATLMHQWKERTLKQKIDEYVSGIVDNLNPLLPTFWEDLARLIEFQLSEVYGELAAKGTKEYKQEQLSAILTKPLGPPPMIAGVYPEIGQSDVPLDQSIMLVFDQPMESSSLEEAIEVSPGTLFAAKPMIEENFIILLRPIEPLTENMTYNVTVSQEAMSLAGMPLSETYEFSFTTGESGPAPYVKYTIPEDGTIDNMAGQPITIRFDQRMSTDSVELAINIIPDFDYSIYWTDGDTTATIQSHEPLEYNTNFTVTVGGSATSGNGVPLGNDYVFSFTTAIMNLPRVLGTLPPSGQGNIPSNHPIQIVFDRSMDTESVEKLLDVSPKMEYSTAWFEADMVLAIEPISPLSKNTKYIISISSGALSSFNLPMANDYEFTFTSGS